MRLSRRVFCDRPWREPAVTQAYTLAQINAACAPAPDLLPWDSRDADILADLRRASNGGWPLE